MKWFGIILLCWFLITLLVLPNLGLWNFDIWTTESYIDIVDALSAPVDILTSLGAVANSFKDAWGAVTDNEVVIGIWDVFKEFSPLYWIYDWITGSSGGS